MPSVHTVIDGRYAYAKIFLVFTVSEMGGGGVCNDRGKKRRLAVAGYINMRWYYADGGEGYDRR